MARNHKSSKTPGSKAQPLIRLRRPWKITARPVRYVIQDLVPRGMLAVLSGKDDRGKTLLALEMARAILRKKAFLGHFSVTGGPVVALLMDDPPGMIIDRLKALGLDKDRDLWVATDRDVKLAKPIAMLKALAQRARKRQAALIIIDALYLLLPPGRETLNDPGTMGPIMRALNRLAHRTGAAVLLIAHDTKGGKDVAGSFVIRAAPKVILRLIRPGKDRQSPKRLLITDKHKLVGPKPTWRLRLDGVGAWTFRGTGEEDRQTGVKEAVLQFLGHGGSGTAKEIAKQVKRRPEDVLTVLKALVRAGQAATFQPAHQGPGRPPVRYRRTTRQA